METEHETVRGWLKPRGEREGVWAYLKRRTVTITLADIVVVILVLGALDLALAIVDGIFYNW